MYGGSPKRLVEANFPGMSLALLVNLSRSELEYCEVEREVILNSFFIECKEI